MQGTGQDRLGGRAQGRPPRGDKEMGRDRIIQKTRDAMRVKPKIDIQRREIAEHAGVTPALVSYYFPDKSHLLELAAQPVIEAYAADVRAILKLETSLLDRLERLVSLFLAFNGEQGFILDHFLEVSYVRRKDKKIEVLASVKQELSALFKELIAAGIVKGDDPNFVQAALWGLCRYVGQGHASDLFQIDGGQRDSRQVLARKVLGMILA